jgi:hypothetical protein
MNIKWLYEWDFKSWSDITIIADYWTSLGYRVFVQGNHTLDCKEV